MNGPNTLSHDDFDLDGIAEAITPQRPSRRNVAKGMAWSLPVIATGIAVPATASSHLPPCDPCDGGVSNCFLDFGSPGACECDAGTVCAGTGPLGLLNVCVGTDLLLRDCGETTCFGVCLEPGGAIITAVNTFSTALSAFVSTSGAILEPLPGTLSTCVNQPGLPVNVCISPFGDGRLGGLCSTTETCGTTTLIAVPLAVLEAAYNGLVDTLDALDVVVTDQCQAPYVCADGASVSLDYDAPVTGTHVFGVNYQLGVCSCSASGTCPGTTTYHCTD